MTDAQTTQAFAPHNQTTELINHRVAVASDVIMHLNNQIALGGYTWGESYVETQSGEWVRIYLENTPIGGLIEIGGGETAELFSEAIYYDRLDLAVAHLGMYLSY